MDRAAPLCRRPLRFRFQTGQKGAARRLGRDGGLLREDRFALPTCSVFSQTAHIRQEMDYKMRSNSNSAKRRYDEFR